MSSSTMEVFTPSQNRMYDRSIPRLEIQNLFVQVMEQLYDLPESAVIEPLDEEARTNYGDYVFFGVLEVCEELREYNPLLFDEVGPIAIAEKVKKVFESWKFEMIKELFLHEAGILTFRLEGRWMAKRINNMLNNGIDTWAPKFFNKRGARAVFILPTNTIATSTGPRMMMADLFRSSDIKDVLANMLLYSGVDVGCGDFDELALDMARKQFTEKRGEIVGKRRPKTSYFRVEGGSNDFYADLATLWYGVHKQEADLMVYMTPHRLRGYIQQCHVAATKEGLLPVDWEGTLTFCGFQTFSGEQQEMFELWRRYRNSPQTPFLERLSRAGYTQRAFFHCACKFTCLKRTRLAKCTFKFEDLLVDIEGNSFGYILETQLLVRSITKDSPGRNFFELKALSAGIERELGLQLVEFTDAVDRACKRLLPDVLCEYLCDLSKLFTRYYDSLDVRPSRNMLGLCTATEAVMNKCCHLLGIDPGAHNIYIPPPSFSDIGLGQGSSYIHDGNLSHEVGGVSGQAPSIGVMARGNMSLEGTHSYSRDESAPSWNALNKRDLSTMMIDSDNVQEFVGRGRVWLGRFFGSLVKKPSPRKVMVTNDN